MDGIILEKTEVDQNSAELNGIEEPLGCKKTAKESDCNNGFIARSTALPIVSMMLSMVYSTLDIVKSQNGTIASLLTGVERSVDKAAYVVSKNVIGLNYLDRIACKALDKVEETFPAIEKPGKEIVKDFSDYFLAKIGGVSEDADIPGTLSDAISLRIKSMKSLFSDALWNNRISKRVTDASNNVLDKAESVVNTVFPIEEETNRNDCDNESVYSRAICIAGETRKRFIGLAKEVSEVESTEEYNLSIKDLASVSNYWLSNVYKKLQISPDNETLAVKTIRVSMRIPIGAALTFNGVVAASWPRFENVASSTIELIKESAARVMSPIIHTLEKTYVPVKSAVTKMVYSAWEKSGEVVDYTRTAYFKVSLEVVNYGKEFYSNIQKNLPEIFNKITISGWDFLKNLDQYFKRSWSAKSPLEDGSAPTPVLVKAAATTNDFIVAANH